MKPAHAVVVLGLVAMVTGAVSLLAVSGGSSEVVDEVAEAPATDVTSDPKNPGWVGVDPSIERVLSDVGLAGRYPEGRLEEIPDEVVRVLATLGVPLVLSEGSGESG